MMISNEEEEGEKETEIIRIDVDNTGDLTLDEYLFIELVGRRGWGIDEAKSRIGNPYISPIDLEREGWVKRTQEMPDGSSEPRASISPRSKFLELVGDISPHSEQEGSSTKKRMEAQYDEFFTAFPPKVRSSSGRIRTLRPATENSKEYKVCKKKYLAILKEHDHKFIMNCLKAELKYRRDHNELEFMKHIKSWLNGHQFEYGAHYIDEYSQSELDGEVIVDSSKSLGHGHELK